MRVESPTFPGIPMRHSRLSTLACLLALTSLAGCAGMVRVVTYEYPQSTETARANLQEAAAAGPVLLEVRDNPFTGDVARSFAAAASETSVGFRATFTTDRNRAARPDFRLVVQFSPAPGVTSVEVCDSTRTGTAAARGEGVDALVAFCNRSQPILSVATYAGRAEGAESPVIKQMAEQAMMRMFIPSGSGRDSPGDLWPDF